MGKLIMTLSSGTGDIVRRCQSIIDRGAPVLLRAQPRTFQDDWESFKARERSKAERTRPGCVPHVYAAEVKEAALADLKAGGLINEVARERGIAAGTLSNWAVKAGLDLRHRRRRETGSGAERAAFRAAVVAVVRAGMRAGRTIKSMARELGVANSTCHAWLARSPECGPNDAGRRTQDAGGAKLKLQPL